jgi:toxin ParE1/3/4
MRLEWLPLALRDFDEIVDYIAADNPLAAIAQGDEIEGQVADLLDNRHLGRPGRIKGTRELVVVHTPYVVAYRVSKGCIQILRVLHGARLWPGEF